MYQISNEICKHGNKSVENFFAGMTDERVQT